MKLRSTLLLLLVCAGCGHGASATCPTPAKVEAARTEPTSLAGLAWADPSALSTPEPLALYDVSWTLLTGDSGAIVPVPPTLHQFTLGRWECAVSAEKANDELGPQHVALARTRRLVCTHSTGLTMQTELSCGFRIPSVPTAGAPSAARREARVSLGDAPSVTFACEPTRSERVALYRGDREPLGEACLVGERPAACPSPQGPGGQ